MILKNISAAVFLQISTEYNLFTVALRCGGGGYLMQLNVSLLFYIICVNYRPTGLFVKNKKQKTRSSAHQSKIQMRRFRWGCLSIW